MPNAFHPVDLIQQKRNGQELSTKEIQAFVHAVVQSHTPGSSPTVSDAQIAAWLMAVFLRGLTPRELGDLTQAMRFSGDTFQVAELHAYTVDKHSTGGVGDKTSLLLAPILAAAGTRAGDARTAPTIAVPMISGRSLGHTGGTLDKLETIPGFTTDLSLAQMKAVLQATGAVLVGQTPTLVPADRVLYALRDHTGTVESPFLITASIMSKKLAEDLRGLVLDVKVGSGAFMPSYDDARRLAELMVGTGQHAGTQTVALLTSMDQPLGRFAGNWLEVWECVDILQGKRHPMSHDLLALTLALAGHMLHLAGACASAEEGERLANEYLHSGKAYAAWLDIVTAQSGDTNIFANPAAFHQPQASLVLRAPRAGYLAFMDCKQVGWAVQRLGAGRLTPGAKVSAHAGLEVHAKLGDRVEQDQPLFTLFTEDPATLEEAAQLIMDNLTFSQERPAPIPLIHEVIRSDPK